MTRINANIPSLIARTHLDKAQDSLDQTLERLATGSRINRAQDDPDGLIISDDLRTQKVGIARSIENAQRAMNVVSTVEASLNEVSALLQDLQRLTVETANTSGISDEEMKANQLRVDSAINSIDRILAQASFGGRKLLDGSLDYTVSGLGDMKIVVEDMKINHASLQGVQAIPVNLEVLTDGRKAEQYWHVRDSFLNYAVDGTSTLQITSDQGTQTLNFATGSYTRQDIVDAVNLGSETSGVTALLSSSDQIFFQSTNWGPDSFVTVNALQPAAVDWPDAETFINNVNGYWTLGLYGDDGVDSLSFLGTETPAQVVAAVNAAVGGTGIKALLSAGEIAFTSLDTGDTASVAISVQPRIFTQSSVTTGANADFGEVGTPATLDWADQSNFLASAATSTASLRITGNDGTANISFAPGVYTANDIVTRINNNTGATGVSAALAMGTITLTSTTTGTSAFISIKGHQDTEATWANTTDFRTAALTADSVLEVTGLNGTQTFTFDTGVFSTADIAAAVNGTSAATGVGVNFVGDSMTFYSTRYAPNAFVNIRALHPIPALPQPLDTSENAGITTSNQTFGSDAAVDIQSINHKGNTIVDGRKVYLRTPHLSLDLTLEDFVGKAMGGRGEEGIYPVVTTFYITGGGATFHVGADANHHNDAGIGLPELSTENIGDATIGFISDIISGGTHSLLSGGADQAQQIIESAINQVAMLRGRLGTYSKNTLETTMSRQRVVLENVAASESAIRDTDFGTETARLTRNQIISSAAMDMLNIANTNPESILQLMS